MTINCKEPSIKHPKVFHPFLFAIYSILFLFAHNISQSSFADLPLPFALIFGLTIVLWALLSVILRNTRKAGILVTLMLIAFFSYGHVYHALEYLSISGIRIGRHRYLLIIYIGIFITVSLSIIKTHRSLAGITKFLNVMSAILVVFNLFNIISYQFSSRSIVTRSPDEITAVINATSVESPENQPDIYYIILDGYANVNTLEQFYSFDNKDFISYLNAKSFYIATDSYTNYPLTQISLASSLNMEYINYLSKQVGENTSDPTIPWQMIRNSKVWQFLKGRGYKFVLIRSGWGPTDQNKFADISIKCGKYNEFFKMMIHTTILVVIEKHLIVLDWHRDNVRQMFTELQNVNSIDGPKFVFVHFIPPHAPFVFGPDGEAVTPLDATLGQNIWLPKQAYVDQMIFVNNQMKKVIDKILMESYNPPVIIIQGDHGPASIDEWDNPSDNFLKERMGILNAYYFPPSQTVLDSKIMNFYPYLSPVNTFRLVLNRCFKEDIDLLEDICYFSNIPTPYKFTDVTKQVRTQ